MPYCKSVAVHHNVKQALTYILNPDKTDERVLTISLNCMTKPEFAYTQMKTVYEQYARRSYDAPPSKSGKSPVKAIHYIMSFADSENVTPELAHKIGMAFVRKMFGDDVQAVIATHVNIEHTHNHILINSYSLTGKRFYDNKASVRKMREVTNGVCRAFGITPALNFENEGRSLNYSEWQHKKKGTSWKALRWRTVCVSVSSSHTGALFTVCLLLNNIAVTSFSSSYSSRYRRLLRELPLLR